MKNAHIRILVILAIVTLVGIVSTQLYWLNRAIEQQDQVFNHNVHLALRNVVESLCEANGKDYPEVNPIEQVSGNYYLVKTNDQIDIANLEYLITAEIRKRAITQAFDYGVYDCQNDQMVFAENVNMQTESPKATLPTLDDQEYYFGVYFPDKPQSIIAGLDLWKFTTVLTIIVILFFGYALFVILRQKRLSEIQRDFIDNVTHELKTPLATLSLASDTLKEKASDPIVKYTQIIQNEVRRLQYNVENILESSFSESRNTVTKESFNLYELISDLVSEYQLQYASQMISWKVEGAECQVNSNKSLIEKSIRNLIENAVKYGGKQIVMNIKQSRNSTTLTISDDGPGIPSKYMDKIFNKFFRVPDKDDQHNVKGFGLGLYIVKSSLKQVNGRIEILENGEGTGTTFLISLPNG